MSKKSLLLPFLLALIVMAVSLANNPASVPTQANPTATPTPLPQPGLTKQSANDYASYISSLDAPPTGSSSEVANIYYDYLYGFYFDQMPRNRATQIWSDMPRDVYAWLAIMLVVFWLYAYVFLYTHRGEGDLHETTSYAGSILERGGKVSAFTWVIIAMLFALALFYLVWFIMVGYLY